MDVQCTAPWVQDRKDAPITSTHYVPYFFLPTRGGIPTGLLSTPLQGAGVNTVRELSKAKEAAKFALLYPQVVRRWL